MLEGILHKGGTHQLEKTTKSGNLIVSEHSSLVAHHPANSYKRGFVSPDHPETSGVSHNFSVEMWSNGTRDGMLRRKSHKVWVTLL